MSNAWKDMNLEGALESTWLFIEIIAPEFIHMPWLPSLSPGINIEEKAKIHSKIEE